MASLCHSHLVQTSLVPSSSTSSTFAFYVKRRNFLGNSPRRRIHSVKKALKVSFALAESDSSNKSLGPSPQILLQELADSFNLPPDYLAKLPSDLRLDLNDAAFDLSNGPVIDQLNSFPSLLLGLALGRRLVSAARRFQGMGQYGQGELQKIAKSMSAAGKLLSSNVDSAASTGEQTESSTRTFKFGELQIQVTSQNAYIGAAISVNHSILSWQISQGIQSTPESSLVYANENALVLAKSLRTALLVVFYGSTVLSAFASVGLVLLGRELSSKEKATEGAARSFSSKDSKEWFSRSGFKSVAIARQQASTSKQQTD
ncbi:hypothetical protein V2J09_019810 [Rumex salicifolius]